MTVTREELTTNLVLVEDVDDASRMRQFSRRDLDALRAVPNWIKTFVSRPHPNLGRAGPVCPFTPGALQRHTLWLASEHIGERGVPEVVELVRDYQRLFKDARPRDGDDAIYKSFVVVFPDLSPERAKALLTAVLDQLGAPSYARDGLVMGPFYETSEGTAIYNATFHPFTSPVPFLLVRQAVVSDWKFFLDDPEFFDLWARRFGETGARALAEEVRRLPWRTVRT
jgi:hypothetical protein